MILTSADMSVCVQACRCARVQFGMESLWLVQSFPNCRLHDLTTIYEGEPFRIFADQKSMLVELVINYGLKPVAWEGWS